MPRHDQLAKNLLQLFLGDLLRLVVPDLAQYLDLEKITLLPDEHFTDIPEGRERRLDIVARLESLQGVPELLLVNVEPESRYRYTTGRRVWHYSMQLRLRYDLPVLSIVVYRTGGQSSVEWKTIRDVLWNREVATFHYVAFSLSKSDAQSFLAHPEPLAAALAALMRPGNWTPGRHKLECLRKVATARDIDDAQRSLLVNFVETYIQLQGEAADEYAALLAEEENQEVTIMEHTWADKLEARGHERGLLEGRREGLALGKREGLALGKSEGLAEGQQRGMQDLLLRQMAQRLGPVPSEIRRYIRSLHSAEELGRVADRILSATDWRDLGIRTEASSPPGIGSKA